MSDDAGRPSILFAIPRLNRGGAQKMQAFVANACVPQFRDVWMALAQQENPQYELHPAIHVHHLLSDRVPGGKMLLTKTIRYACTVARLRRLVRNSKVDVVCAFRVKYVLIARIACFGLAVRVVGAERGSPRHLTLLWRLVARCLYPSCDGMVYQLESVRRMYRDSRSGAAVIPNAYVGHFVSAPTKAAAREPVVATAVARWETSKGIDILLDAFSIIQRRNPHLRLRLYGPVGGADVHQNAVIRLGIAEMVDFRPTVPDVARVLNDVAVFVLPSRHEGIPNILLEMLGAGVPTVACDCPPGGPRLLTADGRRGLLVPVDDAEAMAEAVLRITESADLSQRLSREALDVATEFNDDKVGRMWADYLASVGVGAL